MASLLVGNEVPRVDDEAAPVKRSSLASRDSPGTVGIFAAFVALALGLRLNAIFGVTGEVLAGVEIIINHKRHELTLIQLSKGYLPTVIGDIYESGSYISLTLMVFGCIVMPLVRFTIMTICYILPVNEDYHWHRTQTLFVLDHVGRLMLSDLFFMSYSAIFFYEKVELYKEANQNSRNPLEDLEVRIGTTFYWPFYAALLSNIIGTTLTHRLMLMSFNKTPLSNDGLDRDVPLFDRFDHRKSTNRFYETRGFLLGVLGVLLLALIHLVLFRAPLASFKMNGVLGRVTGADVISYDILTIFNEWYASLYTENFVQDHATYILAATYFIVIIFLPVAICLASIVFVMLPLNKQLQYDILFGSPFWFSWCALDLFSVVTIAQYVELDDLSQYLFRDRFPTICDDLERLAKMNCVGVDAEYHRGLISMLVCVFCLIFVRVRFLWLFEDMSERELEMRLPLLM